MRGGSGADILSLTGAGQKLVWGDGMADGGTAGVDTFRILGGANNFIADYQAGEDIVIRTTAITTPGFGTVTFQSALYWTGVLTSTVAGFESSTLVLLGTTASMSQAAAQAEFSTLLAQDLFLDPALIA